jgi:hypothetical protein
MRNNRTEQGRWAPLLLNILLVVCGGTVFGSSGENDGQSAAGFQGQALESPAKAERCTLANTDESMDALGRHFLEVLARGDREEMAALAVQKEDFSTCVYPTLPASQPGSNLSVDFVWDQSYLRNLAGLAKTLDYAGRKYEYVGLRIADGTRHYVTFTIHRDVRIQVKDETGKELELNLFGSVIESGGRFKIYSFAH